MQIPDGTATVCVEVLHMAKAGHWGQPEKAMQSLGCASQENCSNAVEHKNLQVRILWFLFAEKRLQRPKGALQFFVTAVVGNCRLKADLQKAWRRLNTAGHRCIKTTLWRASISCMCTYKDPLKNSCSSCKLRGDVVITRRDTCKGQGEDVSIERME